MSVTLLKIWKNQLAVLQPTRCWDFIYNKAVADVQERLQARVMEIDIEVHEEEFQYWRKSDRNKKRK